MVRNLKPTITTQCKFKHLKFERGLTKETYFFLYFRKLFNIIFRNFKTRGDTLKFLNKKKWGTNFNHFIHRKELVEIVFFLHYIMNHIHKQTKSLKKCL